MVKPFDPSKFRKSITKSVKGMSIGFNDPDTWVSTGSYALNYRISGDFYKGIPLGKVTVLGGETGCLPARSRLLIQIQNKKNQKTFVKEMRVKELRKYFLTEQFLIEIATPDGFQEVTNWYDKGALAMVQVSTANLTTECAVNHALQLEDLSWVFAKDIEVGANVITINGIERVTSVVDLHREEDCFDFTVKHDNHRYFGDGFSSHNSGKSFIASGNVIRDAQRQGIYVFLVDSENALDEKWLHNLGVETTDDKMTKLNMAQINDVAKTISEFVVGYRAEYANVPHEDRPKVLWVVDSLGMLLTTTQVDQFNAGNLKGDMGHKAKALKALVMNCTNMFGDLGIGLIATNHSYESQDMFKPDPVMAGGSGFQYAASIVIAMQKLKLKEDADGNKITQVTGIRSKCKIMKTRYAKPFEECELKIPYNSGMDPYTGLFDVFEQYGLVVKSGNRYQYINIDTNEETLLYRKAWVANSDGCLDLIMGQFNQHPLIMNILKDSVDDDDDKAQ